MLVWCILLTAAGIVLYVLLTPFGSAVLLRRLERSPPLTASALAAQADIDAIVVLGADYCTWAPEFGGETVGPLTLERMRYGAVLQRLTGYPLLVTGGRFQAAARPLAEHMRDLAENELGGTVRWVEPTALNTFENAMESTVLLRQAGVRRAYLVTHAWHMRRALACFRDSGLEVVAAPTRLTPKPSPVLRDLVPVAACLRASAWAIHEIIALNWYRCTHLRVARRTTDALADPRRGDPNDAADRPAPRPDRAPEA